MTATLFLDPSTWDLTLDASGNIAVATEPYSLAQDAASAIKCFKGENYYDTSQGVPFGAEILGGSPPLSLVRAHFEAAAKTVPGIASAACYFTSFQKGVLAGQVQITDSTGTKSAAAF